MLCQYQEVLNCSFKLKDNKIIRKLIESYLKYLFKKHLKDITLFDIYKRKLLANIPDIFYKKTF